MALLLSQRHTGFLLILLSPLLAVGRCHSAYVIAGRPQARRLQMTKVALWAIAVTVAVSIQLTRHISARRYANTVVQAVEAHARQHGQYPPTLEAAGLSAKEFRERLGLSGYGLGAGSPQLYYSSTYMPFAVEHYDFARREWLVLD